MKTLLASLVVSALAAPAVAGPDFTTPSPRARPLAASTGSSEIGPLDDVVFATDSSQVTGAAYDRIARAARWLDRNAGYRIVVEGYADAVGPDIYNSNLATARAFNVRQQLIGQGVAPDRIIMVVYGEATARGGAHPLDRRVVMYGTKLAPQAIARGSFDHRDALSVVWTRDRTLFTERRTNTVIGTR